jgi:hypothetical protein
VRLQAAPLGYDASIIRDTLAPLLAGGRWSR